MGLLPEVDQPKIQEDRLIVGADLKRLPVDGDGTIGTIGAGIDDAQVAKSGDVPGLLAEYRLESPFGNFVVARRQGADGPIENLFGRLCGAEKNSAET